MKLVIVITGASSGFGALAARRLADAGHTVMPVHRLTPRVLPSTTTDPTRPFRRRPSRVSRAWNPPMPTPVR